jgi:hypothetical protein
MSLLTLINHRRVVDGAYIDSRSPARNIDTTLTAMAQDRAELNEEDTREQRNRAAAITEATRPTHGEYRFGGRPRQACFPSDPARRSLKQQFLHLPPAETAAVESSRLFNIAEDGVGPIPLIERYRIGPE